MSTESNLHNSSLIANNNLLDYDSIFDYFYCVKIKKKTQNNHEYSSDKLTLLITNRLYGTSFNSLLNLKTQFFTKN